MTLNLGDEIPVISTVFGAAVPGGFASIPQSSFNYTRRRREHRDDAAGDVRG